MKWPLPFSFSPRRGLGFHRFSLFLPPKVVGFHTPFLPFNLTSHTLPPSFVIPSFFSALRDRTAIAIFPFFFFLRPKRLRLFFFPLPTERVRSQRYSRQNLLLLFLFPHDRYDRDCLFFSSPFFFPHRLNIRQRLYPLLRLKAMLGEQGVKNSPPLSLPEQKRIFSAALSLTRIAGR